MSRTFSTMTEFLCNSTAFDVSECYLFDDDSVELLLLGYCRSGINDKQVNPIQYAAIVGAYFGSGNDSIVKILETKPSMMMLRYPLINPDKKFTTIRFLRNHFGCKHTYPMQFGIIGILRKRLNQILEKIDKKLKITADKSQRYNPWGLHKLYSNPDRLTEFEVSIYFLEYSRRNCQKFGKNSVRHANQLKIERNGKEMHSIEIRIRNEGKSYLSFVENDNYLIGREKCFDEYLNGFIMLDARKYQYYPAFVAPGCKHSNCLTITRY